MLQSLSPSRQAVCAAAVIVTLTAIGCANPAQPRPPSLRLSEKAHQPSATRLGDQIVFTWTTPAKTTDGEPIRGNITAVVCRETPSSTPVKPCTAVQRVPVIPGLSTATESLATALRTGAPTLLTYRIDLLNAAGRSAGPSAPIYAAGGAAPTPLTSPLGIVARRDGAVITWPARLDDPSPVYLTRTLIQPPGAPKPKPANPSRLPAAKTEPLVVKLRAGGQNAADPGGTIDHSVLDGDVYTYTGERVETVVLSGHALELHGLPSTPVTFAFHDTFPPAAPTGLVSIPGGGFGQAPSVDLSWDPSPERDILGYNVYRADAAITPPRFDRLNPAPIPSSAFRDLQVEPGHIYLYTVTAIDQHHNESPQSTQIHETPPK